MKLSFTFKSQTANRQSINFFGPFNVQRKSDGWVPLVEFSEVVRAHTVRYYRLFQAEGTLNLFALAAALSIRSTGIYCNPSQSSFRLNALFGSTANFESLPLPFRRNQNINLKIEYRFIIRILSIRYSTNVKSSCVYVLHCTWQLTY